MIKYIGCVAGRVAGQTSLVVVTVPVHAAVCIICFRVLVTTYTGKLGVVARIFMTIHTFHPCALVFAAVNGEIVRIVSGKTGRHPAGIGGVAVGAGERKIGGLVVGVCRRLVVGLVAGVAIGGGV